MMLRVQLSWWPANIEKTRLPWSKARLIWVVSQFEIFAA